MEQQVVAVYFLNQLLSAVVLQPPQRALLRHTSRRKQRVNRRRKGTHGIRAGGRRVADDIYPDGAQALQRHVRRNITKLRPHYALYFLLDITKSSPGNQDWAGFRQRQAPFAIHRSEQPLRYPTP